MADSEGIYLRSRRAFVKAIGFWRSVEFFLVPVTVLAEWRIVLGRDYDFAEMFLRPTDELAGAYPCTQERVCSCYHEVIVHASDRIVAVCRCPRRHCRTFAIQAKDRLIYELDRRRLCEAIRSSLGFAPPADENQPLPGLRNTFVVGTSGPTCSPVYFMHRQTSSEFLMELNGLMNLEIEPFILLVPSELHRSAVVQGLMQRQKCAFLDLSRFLELDGPGHFRVAQTPGPILERFLKRLAEKSDTGELLSGIHREIVAVRTNFHQLREAKQRVEVMMAEGLFKFTQKIDSDSLRVFCAILAHGDVAKASRMLNLPDSSVRDRLRKWGHLGKEYKLLLDLVRWRKKIGRAELVRLDESILQRKLHSADYPGLISDVLDGLLSMDEENWREKCDELAEVLRPHANAD